MVKHFLNSSASFLKNYFVKIHELVATQPDKLPTELDYINQLEPTKRAEYIRGKQMIVEKDRRIPKRLDCMVKQHEFHL